MKNLLVDTGVWYAVFDKQDQYYQQVKDFADICERKQVKLI